jgi:hypothetical protein
MRISTSSRRCGIFISRTVLVGSEPGGVRTRDEDSGQFRGAGDMKADAQPIKDYALGIYDGRM